MRECADVRMLDFFVPSCFDLWHERYDPLLRLCYEFEGSTWHFDTELYLNTSWLRVCRYVEPDVDSVRASVGRSLTSHPEVRAVVGVGRCRRRARNHQP